MQNGNTGAFHYHDATYNGSGDVNTDFSALSGGTGYLTDGILGGPFWDSNIDGNSQSVNWVGWSDALGGDPVITFDFGASQTFATTSFYFTNGSTAGVGGGGVSLPAGVTLTYSNDGINFANSILQNIAPDNTSAAARFIDVATPTSARYVRADITRGNTWIFLSEVNFVGTSPTATPEPGSLALCAALGLGGLAALRRRRRR